LARASPLDDVVKPAALRLRTPVVGRLWDAAVFLSFAEPWLVCDRWAARVRATGASGRYLAGISSLSPTTGDMVSILFTDAIVTGVVL
jgi:hypothetical protein